MGERSGLSRPEVEPKLSGVTNRQLLETLDGVTASVGERHLAMLRVIAEADKRELWRDSGYRNTAGLVAGRYGMSRYEAGRVVACSHAIARLPQTAAALRAGRLSLRKVIELTRFATPETETRLIRWAIKVTPGCIARRADKELTPEIEEALSARRARRWEHWSFDGRVGFAGELPAAEGTKVVNAIERIARTLPLDPEAAMPAEARRADALVMLASTRISADQDPDRATVVVHANLDDLLNDMSMCEVEGADFIHPEVARKLACDARIQLALHEGGTTVGIGMASRNVPFYLRRELKRIYGGCCFPGCGSRRGLHSHHVVHWPKGPTDLSNLAPVCPFHHDLVHEEGWDLEVMEPGVVRWFRPDGRQFRAGPSPPSLASGF